MRRSQVSAHSHQSSPRRGRLARRPGSFLNGSFHSHRRHRMQSQRTLLWMVLVALGLSGAVTVQAQTTVVVDNGLGTQVSSLQTDPGQPDNVNVPILGGELLMINPNGTLTAFSDFGNPAQGPIGSGNLGGTAWVPSGPPGEGGGSVAVTDAFAGSNGAGALFLVNPSNGQRTLLSDFGNGWQGLGENPVGVAYV